MKIRKTLILALMIGLAASTLTQAAPARDRSRATASEASLAKHAIVGNWFGRAVPVDPFCQPGTVECPIPPEVIMTPHFFADGSFVGNDTLTFVTPHTTAHGRWVPRGREGAEVNYLFLTSGTSGLAGALRFRFIVEKVKNDVATGTTTAFFFPCADENGQALLDDQGFPTPNPTEGTLPEDCLPGINGCLATFRFTVKRIQSPDWNSGGHPGDGDDDDDDDF